MGQTYIYLKVQSLHKKEILCMSGRGHKSENNSLFSKSVQIFISWIRFCWQWNSFQNGYVVLAAPVPLYVLIAAHIRRMHHICIYHLIQILIIYLMLICGHKIGITKFIARISNGSKILLTVKIICCLCFTVYLVLIITRDGTPSGSTDVLESIFTLASYFVGVETVLKRNGINNPPSINVNREQENELFQLGNHDKDLLLNSSNQILTTVKNLPNAIEHKIRKSFGVKNQHILEHRNKMLKQSGIDVEKLYNPNELIPASEVISILKILSPEKKSDQLLRKLRINGSIKPYKSKLSSKNSGKYHIYSFMKYIKSLEI